MTIERRQNDNRQQRGQSMTTERRQNDSREDYA